MAGTTKKPLNKKPLPKPAVSAKASKPETLNKTNHYLVYGSVILLFLVSVIVFFPLTKNGFIDTWDDGVYILKNKLLHDLSGEGIANMFRFGDDFQKLVNNYHPLTILTLAINYKISGLNPSSYHATNMALHGLNAVLVFIFVYMLTRRKLWPALVSGLLFAVHPMHVESVAWATERKDVLYTFFFLGGLIAYLKYLEDEKIWKLGIVLLLFLFSCLSKAMAAPFPMVLLLIDYFNRRKFSWKLALEKIPFFILALIFGILSVQLQSMSAIEKFETFTLYQRLMHASYGFITYILKFFNPTDLSAIYPYPPITPEGLLPLPFRVAPYILMAVVALFVWIGTRKGEMPRTLVFGILFYFFTIALVLQFISVGKAIMAERYTYIPYIGLAFILGMVTDYYLQRKVPLKYLGFGLAGATVIMVIVFAFMTRDRIKVWNNDIALWSDALRQFPDGRMNFIYEKRAKLYLDQDQYEASLADYMTINANDRRDVNALESMGRIYGKYYKDLGKALGCLEKAYAINPKNPAVLKSLGVAMGMKGNFKGSLDYLLQAYEIDKTDTTLLLNIAASYNYMGIPAKAMEYEQMYKSLKSR